MTISRMSSEISIGPLREDLAFDHGGISRFNAWFFTAMAGYINHIARSAKHEAFAGISASTVVEIGAGTGANIQYLPAGTRLYAIEPSLRMHERLRRRCAAAGVDVTIVATGAEAIPLPDASVDEVICSLVLCTVSDPAQVLAEVRRVLRPGGRFRFVEHVADHRGGVRALDPAGDPPALGLAVRGMRPSPAYAHHHPTGRVRCGPL